MINASLTESVVTFFKKPEVLVTSFLKENRNTASANVFICQ